VATAQSGSRRHPPSGALVLVIDDDAEILALLKDVLEAEGHRVAGAADVQTAKQALLSDRYDLIVLDVMLGGADGRDLLTDIRRTSEVPVILLTARGHETDRIVGLKMGADDYVVKPFSPGELAARVASVLRRSRNTQPDTNRKLDFGDLSIDVARHEVYLDDNLVELTAKEFDLLAFLAGSPRQVFSREQLLEQVWSSRSAWQDPATVTEHIRRVRHKIEANPDKPRWITTLRGVGYRFEP
jgi:two-component system, OmpR family, phosphate regulon response regulator PhoB